MEVQGAEESGMFYTGTLGIQLMYQAWMLASDQLGWKVSLTGKTIVLYMSIGNLELPTPQASNDTRTT